MPTVFESDGELWRDPVSVAAFTEGLSQVRAERLKFSVSGDWWDILAEHRITLLVTREYEHLVLALSVEKGNPMVSYFQLPHPSGIAANRKKGTVYIALTRNPNQIICMRPMAYVIPRADMPSKFKNLKRQRPLLPQQTLFFPGSLYLHDLSLIGNELYANAVGHNAVVQVLPSGGYRYAWWPRCVEQKGKPRTGRNYLQLNSIAAGETLADSYFTASGDKILKQRPGDKRYPVDGRGVVFYGRTRERVVGGLTRPHSARLYRGRLWLNNSGYGEFGRVQDGAFQVIAKLPGWTRGLSFSRGIAFVGTSRVLPRFRHYAPGLDAQSSVCGVHAIELKSKRRVGSLIWPEGNQIFAIDWLPSKLSQGFPFQIAKRGRTEAVPLFYSFHF